VSGELTSQIHVFNEGLSSAFKEKSAPVAEGEEQKDKWEGVNE
jgi:hypothetical protein